jgi:tetratricopeptide (TPR) repeat protein
MAKTKSAAGTQPANQTNTEIYEDPNALVERFGKSEEFVKRNQRAIILVAAVIILAIVGFVTYSYYTKQQDQQAQTEMFSAVYYFEADDYEKALNGDGNNVGLLYIADEYGSTQAGNQAHFYIGAIYLQQGKFQEAADQLEKFSSNDILLQARAYALTGDAYMELGNYGEAESFYQKAADYKANKFFTPMYLMKLALAQEKGNNMQAAADTYNTLIQKYPESPEVTEAKKYKARAEATTAK